MSNTLCRLAVLFFAVAFPSGASAQVQFGTGLICDTPEQVETFAVHSATETPDQALAFVNETAGSTACGVMTVAFVEGPETKQFTAGGKTTRIVEIVVVGMNVGMGWQPVPPLKQFTLFLIEGRGA